MSRRLTSNQFMDMKSRMIPLNMPVVGVLADPRREWKQLCYGGTRVAHSLDVDWKKFNLNDYIFCHASIVSSVATEPNGYYIKPVCSPIVNANGNAWTNAVLLATFKSFIGGYNYCFQAGTEVLMSDGTYKKIEDVEIGDYVISHRGKKQKVLHTFAREYSGEMIETKINHYKNPIISTGNHPFRTVNASFDPSLHARKIKAKHSDRIQRSMVYDALSGRKHFLKNFQAKEQWTNAELLKRGSVLLGEDLPTGDNGINVGDISELLGYYLAEGCLSSKNKHSGVVFVFGKHEEYLARKVEKLSKNVFVGAKVTVTDKTKDFGVWRVQVNSPEASRVFHRLGGHLSHLKKMSEEVFSWDRKSQMNVLVSWLEGDGDFHTETGRIRGSTVSKSLGEQMLYLCRLNGIKASLVFSKARIGEQTSTVHLPRGGEIKDYPVISRHHGWHLHISSSSVEKVINSSTRWDGFVPQLRKNPDFNKWENKNVFLVSSATSFQSTQMVYNIEVEEDNSYLINPGIAVHNCEHIQIPSLSKGTILDAVLRPFIYKDKEGNPVEVYICDILVATSKNHWDLVQKILNGDLNTLSMGTVCFERGTKVILSNGTTKNIEDFVGGEQVITHTGKAKKVLSPTVNFWKGKMFEVSVMGQPDPIICTENHEFMVLTRNEFCACGCGEKLPIPRKKRDRYMNGAKTNTVIFKHGHKIKVYNPMSNYSQEEHNVRQILLKDLQKPNLIWKKASDLELTDIVVTPKGGNRKVALKHPFSYILGLYLAEGNPCNKNAKGVFSSVEWSLGLHEQGTLANELLKVLEDESEIKSSLYKRPNKNLCVVRTHSNSDLTNWFIEHGGKLAQEKVLSDTVYDWDKESLLSMIGGWLDGDGCLNIIDNQKIRLTGVTVSESLAYQIHSLLYRLGIKNSLKKRNSDGVDARGLKKSASWSIEITGQDCLKIMPHTIRWKNVSWVCKEKSIDALYPESDYVFHSLRSIKEVENTEGREVYCLKVEDDHSFLVGGGIAVHNCRDVQCSKCGRIFHDDEDSCEHIQDELLTNFKDENGIIRIVAELCGSSHWDQRLGQWVGNPDSNKFIEASWVQNPAYVGAVINHFIKANMINGEIAGNFGKEPSLEDAIMMSMGMRVADSYGRLSLKLIRERHLELQRLNTINRVASSSRLLKF